MECSAMIVQHIIMSIVIAMSLFAPAIGPLYADNPIDVEDDEPLEAFTRMAFDPLANKIVPAEESGRHVQQMGEAYSHFFFEAETMTATATYMNLEWVNTRVGYPELYPAGLSTEKPRPLATNSPFLSGTGVASILPGTHTSTLSQELDIEESGTYRLWVRYQSIRQLPAPFELVIKQGEQELLRQVFNEESSALCRLAARLLWESTDPVELQEGRATIKLVKTADEDPGPIRGPRYVDCFLLTSHLDYVAGGGELLPSHQEIQNRIDKLAPDGDSEALLWSRGRYEGFFITSWPGDSDALNPSFSYRLPGNAHANRLLLITSISEKPLRFTTRLNLHDEEGKQFPGSAQVRVVGHMISRFFDHVPHVLMRRSKTTVAPYHTTGLWISIESGTAPAGRYEGKLELLRDNETPFAAVPVKVEILEGSIQDDPDLYVLLWGHPTRTGRGHSFDDLYPSEKLDEMRERYWSNALALGWNVFQPNLPWPAEEARQRGIRALRVGARSRQEPGTEKFAEEVRENLSRRVGELRELGWRDSEMWIQAFDEPSAGSSMRWLAHARIIKEQKPEVKMWTNPGWHRGQTAEAFSDWAPYVDVWWPYASNLPEEDLLNIMKDSGKPIGFYIERGWSGFNPGAAWAYFRRTPMLTAKYDLQGCGFWSTSVYYEDPWDDLNTRVNYSKAAVFYPGSEGPINAINASAWREGMDELIMLRSAAARGKLRAVEWAQKFLDADTLEKQDALRHQLMELFADYSE